MAIKGKFRITCPSCDHEFEGDFWTVVRGDRDFKLKKLLIEGEFDLFMCPLCKKVFVKEEAFVYHDPKMDLFVFVLPSAYMANSYPSLPQDLAQPAPSALALALPHHSSVM